MTEKVHSTKNMSAKTSGTTRSTVKTPAKPKVPGKVKKAVEQKPNKITNYENSGSSFGLGSGNYELDTLTLL